MPQYRLVCSPVDKVTEKYTAAHDTIVVRLIPVWSPSLATCD